MNSRVLAVALLCLLVTGCTLPRVEPLDDWNEHRALLEQLDQWQLTGRLGVRVPGDSGSANLRWEHSGDHYRLDLSGPLGQGRFRITGRPGEITLEQAGREPITSASAEDLIWEATGWILPVDHLVYWVKGIPSPDSAVQSRRYNEQGLLEELQQAHWQLSYDRYSDSAGIPLPGRIIAQRNDRSGDIRLTLLIRQWEIDNQ